MLEIFQRIEKFRQNTQLRFETNLQSQQIFFVKLNQALILLINHGLASTLDDKSYYISAIMSSKLTVKVPGENEDQPENIKELKPRKPRNKRRYKTKKPQVTRKSNRLSTRKTPKSPKETKVSQDETENPTSNMYLDWIRSNAKWIALSLGGIIATIVIATIVFFLWSDQ